MDDDGVAIPTDIPVSYLERARSSAVPLRHLLGLIAVAQLDDEAPPATKIGYGALFDATCEHGQRHWLDPLPLLQEINETLYRYLAPREALGPVVEILVRLATVGISPYAALDYIVVPRLREDRNWRRWGTVHLPVIAVVTDIITDLRSVSPYDRPYLGAPIERRRTRRAGSILTDIFLVKYVAAAFTGRDTRELSEAVVEAIEKEWLRLRLESRGFLLFLRYNLRPFLAKLEKRLDIRQYVEIIAQLPEIESRIAPRESWRSGRSVVPAALYGGDPGTEIERRERHGYKAIHFLREFRSVLEIYTTLLARAGGIGAIEQIVRRIRTAVDPTLSGYLARLVGQLQDTGGRHIYMWHAVRLTSLPETERDAFVHAVVTAGGAHPDYPRYADLFRLDEYRFGRSTLTRLAVALGLPEKRYESPRTVFREYIALHPQIEPVVEEFKRDIATGGDRRWSDADRLRYDTLGGLLPAISDPRTQPLHSLLLYSTIRGLSGQYTRGVNSQTLTDLWGQYPTDPYPGTFDIRIPFTRAELSTSENHTQKTPPKTVKIKAIQSVWERVAIVLGAPVGYAEVEEIDELDETDQLPSPNPPPSPHAPVETAPLPSPNPPPSPHAPVETAPPSPPETPSPETAPPSPYAPTVPTPPETPSPETAPPSPHAPTVPTIAEAIAEQYRILSRSLADVRAEKGAEHTATRRLSRQVETLATIQDEFSALPEVGVLAVGILLAGYYGRKAEHLRIAALSTVFQWIGRDSKEQERLTFLRDDINLESITLQQTEFLVAFLTDTAEMLAASPEASRWIIATTSNDDNRPENRSSSDSSPLGEFLAPLALTKQRELTTEALDAAFRSIVNLSTLSKELAKWRETVDADSKGDADSPVAGDTEHYELFVSRTPFDSYYGDMGATCLSESPGQITDPGFLTIRLSDRKRNEIVGMAAMQYVPTTVASLSLHGYWFAFAFNPLRAVTTGLGETERLNLYLKFRTAVSHVAEVSRRPVLLPGIAVYGLVSNDTGFGDMIIEYERAQGGTIVTDARGFALQYPHNAYARAIVMNLPKVRGAPAKT